MTAHGDYKFGGIVRMYLYPNTFFSLLMTTVPNGVSQIENITRQLLLGRLKSVLTSQPKEINRHIEEPCNFIQSFDSEDSETNRNVPEANLWSPNSPPIQIRDQWIHRSPQQLVSQTSRLACQVTEISVDIPIIRIPKRSLSPVETQSSNEHSTPRRTKRRRTTFTSTS
ncbi:unnamed protein product [Adineta ricciae]|uniref:Uncharacterized protein n=1 Tax=Adineta ricciae TaxID=249248 RepID=A0A813VJ50_ADIRI|nr:unnamed protein product [Adineta ricciae]CAF1326736.1 unnamed protein product [Adineta ricciae]